MVFEHNLDLCSACGMGSAGAVVGRFEVPARREEVVSVVFVGQTRSKDAVE